MLSTIFLAASISAVVAAPHEKRQSTTFCTVESSYTSAAGDTCESIETKFNLTPGSVLAANSYLNCADIWEYTPICLIDTAAPIPPTSSSSVIGDPIPPPRPTTTFSSIIADPTPPTACQIVYISVPGDNCDNLDRRFSFPAGTTLAANSFLDCDNIPSDTRICIPFRQTSSTIEPTSTFSPVEPTPACRPYTSIAGENCANIEARYRLAPGALKAANDFLNCDDVWPYTPLCIPNGPYVEEPQTCIEGSYTLAGWLETCEIIESKLSLPAGDLIRYNPNLDCKSGRVAGMPVKVCIPVYEGIFCKQTIQAPAGATCDSIARGHGLISAQIKAFNTFVNCDDIWENTPVCVSQ